MAAYLLAAAVDDLYTVKVYTRVADLNDFELHTRTHLDRTAFRYLQKILHDDLVRQNENNFAIPSDTQLLVGLTFLATGAFQRSIGDMYGVSQTSTSSIIQRVVDGLNHVALDYIRFPETVSELNGVKDDLYCYGGIRNVVGIIDCTHVSYQPRKDEEASYLNRKGGHSINVQLICDGKHKITDAVAKYPGSVKDSFIWACCGLRERLEAGDGWLIGDDGYPLEPWLLTQYSHAANQAQKRFNASIGTMHSLMENVICTLKSRWRVLLKTEGEMLYDPGRVCAITIACCVLHNICVDNNVSLRDIEMVLPEDPGEPEPEDGADEALHELAVAIRDLLVETDFTR